MVAGGLGISTVIRIDDCGSGWSRSAVSDGITAIFSTGDDMPGVTAGAGDIRLNLAIEKPRIEKITMNRFLFMTLPPYYLLFCYLRFYKTKDEFPVQSVAG
jgi:hypothetical protein